MCAEVLPFTLVDGLKLQTVLLAYWWHFRLPIQSVSRHNALIVPFLERAIVHNNSYEYSIRSIQRETYAPAAGKMATTADSGMLYVGILLINLTIVHQLLVCLFVAPCTILCRCLERHNLLHCTLCNQWHLQCNRHRSHDLAIAQ